jgi:hypothetical protein
MAGFGQIAYESAMMRAGRKLCAICAVMIFCAGSVQAVSARIIKTLPHYLDLEGRNTIHPSLFERDGYQAELKLHPEKCSGMSFDVQWKGKGVAGELVKVRLEVRGEKTAPRQTETFEQDVKARRFSQWSSLKVSGPDFTKTGKIIAWRVTIWQGGTQLAEQKSFLW